MVGVAFVSRVAKNFQDYFTNVIVQRLGAKMYSDGIHHSLDLPYQVFEDSAAEKRWASCKRFAAMWNGLLPPRSM